MSFHDTTFNLKNSDYCAILTDLMYFNVSLPDNDDEPALNSFINDTDSFILRIIRKRVPQSVSHPVISLSNWFSDELKFAINDRKNFYSLYKMFKSDYYY